MHAVKLINNNNNNRIKQVHKILARLKIGDFILIRQFAKFNSSPIFFLIRYFFSVRERYTHALPKYLTIDSQLCFHIWLFADAVEV